MCENEENLIVQADFACIGDVARHCDNKKLCIAIGQAQDFDLAQLFCGFWYDIVEIFNEITSYDLTVAECEANPDCNTPPTPPENYAEKLALLCGGYYEGCNGKRVKHLGVKKMLVYYAYAKYLFANASSDTPNGKVSKTNEWSIPKPLKEIEMEADHYRSMGFIAFSDIKSYLCKNRDIFPDYVGAECDHCHCEGNCDGRSKAKGYGFKSCIISKRP